jgi:hypothetical protein
MKTFLKKKLDDLDVYLNKGGVIVLGEDFFLESFYRNDKGEIVISNYLNNELSEAIRYLNKKGISLEIMAGPPLRYMFTKN